MKTEREKETERHKPTLVNTYADVQRYKARQKENENERERERERESVEKRVGNILLL